MTPTTSSPSIVLLNPVVQPSKAAPASDAEAKPDAAVSGFQLLLGAMQQVQQKLPAGAGASGAAAKSSDAESGNTLPLLGTILPLAGLSAGGLDEAAKADAANAKQLKDKKDQGAKDLSADAAAVDLMSPIIAIPPAPSGFVIQTPRANSGGSATAPSAQADAVMSALAGTDAALSAQSGALKDSGVNRTDNKAVASLPVAGVNALDTAAGIDASKSATTSIDVLGASKHLAESDFDVLAKHFDVSSQLPPTVNISDSAGAHQASRTYADAANSAATVSVPVGNSGWSDAIADKVMWFSANKISSAEIHLNPPDLGPLQVRVSTQHDQASIVFTSPHAAVRDALDQALPRLRDMMGSQGMHLLDVSVGGQSAQQQQQQQQFSRHNPADRGASLGGFFSDDSSETAVIGVTAINTARLLRSGVDAYA